MNAKLGQSELLLPTEKLIVRYFDYCLNGRMEIEFEGNGNLVICCFFVLFLCIRCGLSLQNHITKKIINLYNFL